MYTPNLSGRGPAFDSKSDQLTIWSGSHSVADAPDDHGGNLAHAFFDMSTKTFIKRSLPHGYRGDHREKLPWWCQICFASNLKTEWVPAGEVR